MSLLGTDYFYASVSLNSLFYAHVYMRKYIIRYLFICVSSMIILLTAVFLLHQSITTEQTFAHNVPAFSSKLNTVKSHQNPLKSTQALS